MIMRVLLVLVLTIMVAQVATAQNRSELEKQRSEIHLFYKAQ